MTRALLAATAAAALVVSGRPAPRGCPRSSSPRLRRLRGIDPARVGALGWSIGGGLALATAQYGAGQTPLRGSPFRVLVVLSAYDDSPNARALPPYRPSCTSTRAAPTRGRARSGSPPSGGRSRSCGAISVSERGDELAAAEHPLKLLAPLVGAELLDPRVRRVAGHLLDAEVPVGEARDLWEVRDRHDLGPLSEPSEGRSYVVRGSAADARVDLVEDERLAAADGRDRERDPRQLAARRRLGDRRERQARVRPDEEGGSVRAIRAWVGRRQLDAELALAHADAVEFARYRLGEARRGLASSCCQLFREAGCAPLGRGERLGRRGDGVEPAVERVELEPRLTCACEELLVRRAAEAALEVGDPVELGLDVLEAPRLGVERREERREVARGLAEPELDVAELVRGALQLGREALERGERALGVSGERRRSLAVLGREGLTRGGRARRQLGHVA